MIVQKQTSKPVYGWLFGALKKSEIHAKIVKLYKEVRPSKSLDEKVVKSKVAGKEIAAMMLMLITFNNGSLSLTSLQPFHSRHLCFHNFFTQAFEASPFLYSLAVFA